MREVRRADAIGFLRGFGFRAGRQERVAAHGGGLVDEEGRPRLAPLQPREGPGRAGVEHRDAHVGGNLIEPIAQRAVRVAVVAEQQAPLVGVPGVVEQHLRAAARRPRGPARFRHARAQLIERVEEIFELGLPEDDFVRRRHAAELDQHAGEALGVGDGVLQAGPLGASVVRADHEREPLHGRGRLGTACTRHAGQRQRQTHVRREPAGGRRTHALASRSGLFLQGEGGLRELARDTQAPRAARAGRGPRHGAPPRRSARPRTRCRP